MQMFADKQKRLQHLNSNLKTLNTFFKRVYVLHSSIQERSSLPKETKDQLLNQNLIIGYQQLTNLGGYYIAKIIFTIDSNLEKLKIIIRCGFHH